ncbi:hypothetical protein [Mesorhizobium sp. M0802]|uniref:hypothetical protein n=1 Tax=Mesorhizobium sp. M0802 TaxID=2957001 RepID=UPI00333CEC9C
MLFGRAIDGLDEFMQRLGHLTALLIAADESTSSHRTERRFQELLTAAVSASEEDVDLARYLLAKNLAHKCDMDSPRTEDVHRKYDSFCVTLGSPPYLRSSSGHGDFVVDWQDKCFASPEVLSKTGAISTTVRSGSKTPISHILDWANLLGLINSSANLSAEGRAALWLHRRYGQRENPYILSYEKIVYAYLVFKSDFDVLTRLIAGVARKAAVDKKSGTDLYLEILGEIYEDSSLDNLPGRERQNLTHMWRDVYKGTSRNNGSASTAWHRVSSRLEILVDLGLLTKRKGENEFKHEYKYFISPRGESVSRTFEGASDPDAWIAEQLVFATFGIDKYVDLSVDEVVKDVTITVDSLGVSIGLVPIDPLCLSIAALRCAAGSPTTFGTVRSAIENAAVERPEIFRLARGSYGPRAEYVSINRRGLVGS